MLDPLETACNRSANNVTILIADDEPSLRSLLSVQLSNSVAGVDVLQAGDGAEARQLGAADAPEPRPPAPPTEGIAAQRSSGRLCLP